MTLLSRLVDACAGLFCRAFGLRSHSRWSIRVGGADRYCWLASLPKRILSRVP